MRGTSFQKPLEFNLQVEGESWRQGDPVSGELVIKNHGSEAVTLSDIHVHLAVGDLKKVRAKAEGAFRLMASTPLGPGERIESGRDRSFGWKFETDRNFPITDNSSSPFIVYGHGASGAAHLQLSFQPYWVIEEFLKTFQTAFRFVLKTRKSGKGAVELKLVPPSAKNFAALEYVTVSLRFEGEDLSVSYAFSSKKLEATASSLGMKKEKRTVEQVFTRAQYLTSSGRIHYEALEDGIRQAIA